MLACRNSLGRAPKKRRTTAPRLRTFGNASDATSYDGHQKRLGGFGGWHDARRGTYQVQFTDAPGTVPAVVGGGRSVFFRPSRGVRISPSVRIFVRADGRPHFAPQPGDLWEAR